jgi:hypothetical protein
MVQRSRYLLLGFFALFTIILLTFYFQRASSGADGIKLEDYDTYRDVTTEISSTTGPSTTTTGEITSNDDDEGDSTEIQTSLEFGTSTTGEDHSTTGPAATTGTTGSVSTTGTTGTTGHIEVIQKTRHYIVRQERADKFLKWFHEMVANASDTTSPRILILPATSQWGIGNTYLGFLTLLLYTILTDRVLLLEDNHTVGKVFDLPWEWKWNAEKSDKYHKEVVKKDYVNGCFWDQDRMAQWWQNEDFESFLTYNPATQIPAMITNCPGFHWIAMNPMYTEKLQKLGIVPSGVPVSEYGFHSVGFLSKLFLQKYTYDFKSEVETFQKNWESKGANVIGMQMRTGKMEGDGRFLDDNQIEFMFGCVDKLVKANNNSMILLTTDFEPLFGKARTWWPGKLVEVTGQLGHVSQNGDAVFHRSALEMLLLSKTNDLFFTAASTFGASAAFLGYMAPLYVTVESPMSCAEASVARGPGGKLTNSLVW